MIWNRCPTRTQLRTSPHTHLWRDADAVSENCVLSRIKDVGQSIQHSNNNSNTSPDPLQNYVCHHLIRTNKYAHLALKLYFIIKKYMSGKHRSYVKDTVKYSSTVNIV
jgi:hypothetical protein